MLKLISAEEIRTGVRVNYQLIDDAGTAKVNTVMPEENLVDFIEAKGLNLVTDFSYDCIQIDAYEYLSSNLDFVVTEYLQFNLAA
jgi:hypothetical protein